MDFRRELAKEFARRQAGNACYSLRAFARDLSIDHASLSQILRNRRALSARMTATLGRRIGYRGQALVEASIRQDARAIARLIRSGKFQPNCRWIAVRTGIPVDAVNAALAQLLNGGGLKMRSARRWTIRENTYV